MTKPEFYEWIAGHACEALAELSSLYDDTGMESQALMCEWSGNEGGAGENAARRAVASITDLVTRLKSVR